MNDVTKPVAIRGQEHWTGKDDNVKLFMFEKSAVDPNSADGTILFVHGSSMASQPTFDLQVDGRPDSSVMDWFARRGFDCWCVDMEGYGRSTKDRDNNAPIAQGADDCLAAATYIRNLRGKRPLLVYGISSGALRAALFAQRHPQLVGRLALDAMVWTGAGSPTLAERKKKLPEFKAKNRRPIDKAFIHSIFDRDHPGTAEEKVIDAFADAVTALDDSVPTGTYVDFDEGLNTAVRKLRAALGDSPESPVFVETVPRRGYVLWARLITCRPPASYHLLYNMRAITAMEFHRSQRRQTRPPLRFRPKSAEIS